MTVRAVNGAAIRSQVLRALALNRTPGLHFLGNFLDLSFERVGAADSCLRMTTGPHCDTATGEVHIGALALLADIAMATAVRASLPPETRLGTVSLSLQFTGLPWVGPLEAHTALDGFLPATPGAIQSNQHPIGLAHGVVGGPRGVICRGSCSFMALEPPDGRKLAPVPHRRHSDGHVPPLEEDALQDHEAAILRYTDDILAVTGCPLPAQAMQGQDDPRKNEALPAHRFDGESEVESSDGTRGDSSTDGHGGSEGSDEGHAGAATGHAGGSFADKFFGYEIRRTATGASGRMRNGPHIGNRVGHVQGGVSFGFALKAAQIALGSQWRVSNLTASYVSAGQGESLRALSRTVHLGRRTAVVHTRILGAGGRIVLDVKSHHWQQS